MLARRAGWRAHAERSDGGSARIVTPALWIAAVGVGAGVLIMYGTEAQQSRLDRVSTLIPAHLVPYASVVAVAYVVAAAVLTSLWHQRPVAETLRMPGVALGGAAGVAALAAVPADLQWHAAFGHDWWAEEQSLVGAQEQRGGDEDAEERERGGDRCAG